MVYSKKDLLEMLGMTTLEKGSVKTYTFGEAIDSITEKHVLVLKETLLKGCSHVRYIYIEESSEILTDELGNVEIFPLKLTHEDFIILNSETGLFL